MNADKIQTLEKTISRSLQDFVFDKLLSSNHHWIILLSRIDRRSSAFIGG